MPKTKSSPKNRSSQKSAAPKSRGVPTRKREPAFADSEEYAEYLERYELYGDDRPRLSPAEFNRLDDELLDLLAEAEEGTLSDEQMIRLHELEFLLLDEQSDSSPF